LDAAQAVVIFHLLWLLSFARWSHYFPKLSKLQALKQSAPFWPSQYYAISRASGLGGLVMKTHQ